MTTKTTSPAPIRRYLVPSKVMPAIVGYMAREANQVVVLKRGSGKVCQMLVWDLATDQVIPGQWMKATPLFQDCDVSPDGRYFVGVYQDYRGVREARDPNSTNCWIAISRPPYFTALAGWHRGYNWGRGCVWVSNEIVAIDGAELPMQRATPLVRVHQAAYDGPNPLIQTAGEDFRLKRDGWEQGKANTPARREQFPTVPVIKRGYGDELWDPFEHEATYWKRSIRGGRIELLKAASRIFIQLRARDGALIREVTSPEYGQGWFDADLDGCLIYAEDGCLWRWPGFPEGEPVCVADLSGLKFKALPPPDWALAW